MHGAAIVDDFDNESEKDEADVIIGFRWENGNGWP